MFASLELARVIYARELTGDAEQVVKTKKLFGFVHETISVLSPHAPEVAVRLFLQAGLQADACSFEAIAYEFVAQAFLVFEEEVSDSKAQFSAIQLIAATLQRLTHLNNENYDTLVSKATQHSAKVLASFVLSLRFLFFPDFMPLTRMCVCCFKTLPCHVLSCSRSPISAAPSSSVRSSFGPTARPTQRQQQRRREVRRILAETPNACWLVCSAHSRLLQAAWAFKFICLWTFWTNICTSSTGAVLPSPSSTFKVSFVLLFCFSLLFFFFFSVFLQFLLFYVSGFACPYLIVGAFYFLSVFSLNRSDCSD